MAFGSISVIIPTFNRAATLRRAVDSVLSQTVAIDELVIVDDASTDGTVDWIRKNYGSTPGVQLLSLTENLGVSGARNMGVRKSSGDWVAFLDSDDEWLPEKVENQLRAIGDRRWVHSHESWIRNGEPLRQLSKHRKEGGDIFDRSLHLCLISPSSVMIQRDLFLESGGFDESLPVCEDYDLWLRLLAYEPIAYSDEVGLIKYGGHSDQLSHRYFAMDFWRVRALLKQTELSVHSEERIQRVWTVIAKKCEILIRGYRKHQNTKDLPFIESIYERAQSIISTGSRELSPEAGK